VNFLSCREPGSKRGTCHESLTNERGSTTNTAIQHDTEEKRLCRPTTSPFPPPPRSGAARPGESFRTGGDR